VSMAATPLLNYGVRRIIPALAGSQAIDPELSVSPASQPRCAIIVGYGRVGKVVSEALRRHSVPYIATDCDPQGVINDRRAGHNVFFGDAADPEFLRVCGIEDAAGLIITINSRDVIDDIVTYVRSIRPEILIIAPRPRCWPLTALA